MSRWRGLVRPPELAELETLVACATDGSFASAAQRMGISRPAIAKRIDNLEALAGRPLLRRGPSGVTLTDAGAAVLAGARRMLEERDVLVGVLVEIRDQAPSSISGLRSLLGNGDVGARSAQLAETRLADTERLFELILRNTLTAVAISNPETGVVYEANDAFCRLAGRTRAQLVGRHAWAHNEWYESAARRQLIDEVRERGSVAGVLTRFPQPDGSVRMSVCTAYLVSIAAEIVLLVMAEDVSDQYPEEAKGGGDKFPLAGRVQR
jgi:PAS domain S-box-containing protein